MHIHCPRCNQDGIASAIIPGICTFCANEERGIVINPSRIRSFNQAIDDAEWCAQV